MPSPLYYPAPRFFFLRNILFTLTRGREKAENQPKVWLERCISCIKPDNQCSENQACCRDDSLSCVALGITYWVLIWVSWTLENQGKFFFFCLPYLYFQRSPEPGIQCAPEAHSWNKMPFRWVLVWIFGSFATSTSLPSTRLFHHSCCS